MTRSLLTERVILQDCLLNKPFFGHLIEKDGVVYPFWASERIRLPFDVSRSSY